MKELRKFLGSINGFVNAPRYYTESYIHIVYFINIDMEKGYLYPAWSWDWFKVENISKMFLIFFIPQDPES